MTLYSIGLGTIAGCGCFVQQQWALLNCYGLALLSRHPKLGQFPGDGPAFIICLALLTGHIHRPQSLCKQLSGRL